MKGILGRLEIDFDHKSAHLSPESPLFLSLCLKRSNHRLLQKKSASQVISGESNHRLHLFSIGKMFKPGPLISLLRRKKSKPDQLSSLLEKV